MQVPEQLSEHQFPRGWDGHGPHIVQVCVTAHDPRMAAAYAASCLERSLQGKLGNAPSQSFRSGLPKAFQLGGAHGGDREGCGIHHPGHLIPP